VPYEADDAFPDPGAATLIWRHINVSKFVSLIATRCLWFSRVSDLEDRFEGSYPAPNAARRRAIERLTVNLGAPADVQATYLSDFYRDLRARVYVNCWYAGEHESAALWQAATREGASVAIKSTFGALTGSIQTGEEPFHAGGVSYLDYRTEELAEGHLLSAFFCKRKSYEHEHEVRAVIHRPDDDPLPGLAILVDIESLVSEVVVAPSAPTWVRDIIRSLVTQYGFDFPVTQSALDADPLY
jgi:hypothetical protein